MGVGPRRGGGLPQNDDDHEQEGALTSGVTNLIVVALDDGALESYDIAVRDQRMNATMVPQGG